MPAEIVRLLDSPDPVVHSRLSYGAFVGVRYPYLYIETPKAACTTTKGHLWRLEGLPALSDPNDVHRRTTSDVRLSLITAGRARAIEAMCGKSVFRFCVWRDPVRRLASCYMAKIRLRRDPRPEWALYRKAIAELSGLRAEDEIGFEHFARFVCTVPDELREPHFMSQWQLTLSAFLRYDRIVMADQYSAGMADVYRAIGVPPHEWPDFGAVRENFTGSETVEIATPVAGLIRDAYRKDYEMAEKFAGYVRP